MHLGLLSGGKLPHKGGVFLARHGTVDIVRAAAVVARGIPRAGHIHGFQRHERRGGIEKVQIIGVAEIGADRLAHGVRGERPRGDDDRAFRYARDLAGNDADIGVLAELLRHHGRKAVAVDRETAARLDTRCVRAGEDQTVQPAQLLLEQADRIFQPVTAQGVGADQLGKVRAVVRRRHFFGLHLIKRHGKAALRELPRGLAARQTRADHFHFCHAFFVPLAFVDFAAVFFAGFFVFFSAGVSTAVSSSAVSTVSVVALGIRRL